MKQSKYKGGGLFGGRCPCRGEVGRLSSLLVLEQDV